MIEIMDFQHVIGDGVTIGSPIVRIYSQVADLGSACKLAPQSPGLPQTERLSMRVLKLVLKLREVSSLSVRTIYSFPKRSSDQTYVNKHQQTWKRSVKSHLTCHMIGYPIWCHES